MGHKKFILHNYFVNVVEILQNDENKISFFFHLHIKKNESIDYIIYFSYYWRIILKK